MNAEKLLVDLAIVLPRIPDEQDACIHRLTSLLEGRGIVQAHVVRENGRAQLCMHYDPKSIGLAEVQAPGAPPAPPDHPRDNPSTIHEMLQALALRLGYRLS